MAGAISSNEWQNIKGIGEKAGESLALFFRNKKNIREIRRLGKFGVKIVLSGNLGAEQKTEVSGKTFVFTGMLSRLTRDQAKEIVRAAGGEISSSVSPKTNFVVAGK